MVGHLEVVDEQAVVEPLAEQRPRTHLRSKPLVSVVILSFNSAHLLPRAVDSVLEQTYASIELIIVDNASTDGTAPLLDHYSSVATIVRNTENLGFARGMNAGYDRSYGDIFVPLNTDAVLDPHFIQASVELFEQQPQLGVIAPEVYKIALDGPWRFWEAPHQLQSEGGVVALNTLLRVQVLLDHSDDWRPSFKANGACPVIRRSLLAAMQQTFGSAPFDPVFDTYGEDVDFAFKAWALRWRTMFARHIVAGHVRSYASALELPDKRGRLRINLIAERYINAIRHLPLPRMLKVVVLALSEDLQMFARQLAKGDQHIMGDLLTGWRRVLNMLPDLWHFRQQHHTWQTINYDAEVYCRSRPLWFGDSTDHTDMNPPSLVPTTFDEERT